MTSGDDKLRDDKPGDGKAIDENKLVAERRGKLAALRAREAVPFPRDAPCCRP